MPLTQDQHEVLTQYARGAEVAAIATLLRKPQGFVVGVVENVAKYNRAYARTLVQEQDEHRLNGQRVKTPATPPKSGPDTEAWHDRDVAVSTALAHKQQESTMDTQSASTDVLLKTAETSGIPRAERLAHTIREKLAELAALMEGTAEQRRLQAEIDVLQKHLNERKAELAAAKAGRPATAPTSEAAPTGKRDSKAIRAWAAETGVTCPGHGRIPGYVMDAYDKAHPAES
jgi:DNA-binding protein H-NS